MIAKTILQQIGGKRFATMTGSRNFIDMGNGLLELSGRADFAAAFTENLSFPQP